MLSSSIPLAIDYEELANEAMAQEEVVVDEGMISRTSSANSDEASVGEANKENLPPIASVLKKKRLSKQGLKKALIESEKLKRSAVVAAPVSAKSNASLSSVAAFMQKQKSAAETIELRKTKTNRKSEDVRDKPWARKLSKEELEKIMSCKPKLSHDSDLAAAAGSSVMIIKTQQCGRSDASKERMKAGILPRPTKNSLLELNRKLETKIREQSTEAWRERLTQMKRPSKAVAEEDEQVTEEEEELEPSRKPDKQQDFVDGLLVREDSSAPDEPSSPSSENGEEDLAAEDMLDSLLNEATQGIETPMDVEQENVLQRQQKSIMGFLSKDAIPMPDDSLFPSKQPEAAEPVEEKETKRKTKLASYFFDEEAHTDDDDDSEGDGQQHKKKKKKRSKHDDDESIDEAEIERELRESKFLVDEADGEDNEDQIRATHSRLQLEADRANIEKLTRKFQIDSESEYYEEEEGNDQHTAPNESIWAGKILSSDPRIDDDQLTDATSEESIVRSEPEIEEDLQSSLRTEHRTALDDLLKLSSVMDLPDNARKDRKPARSLLPTSRTLVPEGAAKRKND